MAGWRGLAAALVFGVAVAACGQGGGSGGEGGGGESGAQADGAQKSARVRCPPRVRTAARAANAPVDDIAGVRPGLTLDEAANVIQCEDRGLAVEFTGQGFRIETHGIQIRQTLEAKPTKPPMTAEEVRREYMEGLTSSRNRDELEPGQQRFNVSAMGVPGEERVIGVWREQRFEAGRNPPIQSVHNALIEKYGQPSVNENGTLRWLWDAMGRPIGRDSPIISQCQGIGATGNYINFNPECGLSIAAGASPMRDNPDLADSLSVGVADQAKGYQAIQDTEAALANMDAQRRAQELEKANKNADAPDL